MNWLSNNYAYALALLGRHLALALPAVVVALLIAVPLGYAAYQNPRLGRPLAGAATMLYAIPALPLLLLIPALTGLPIRSPLTMVTALVVYGVALLVRATGDAFAAGDAAVMATATAMGLSERQLFWRVRLPLAVPLIAAGLRVVAVSTVGLVTIGALVGIPSLGLLITDGFQRGITASVAAGVLGTALLGLLLDAAIVLAARALTPWARAASLADAAPGPRMSAATPTAATTTPVNAAGATVAEPTGGSGGAA